jgi:hypothetical protein
MHIRTVAMMGAIFLTGAMSLAAQGQSKGHARPATTPGSAHSNAPGGTPAASGDRDKGTERAEEVGKGKKKGLNKPKATRKRTKR